MGLDVTDIPGATARLPKEVTVRDPLDYRDVPLVTGALPRREHLTSHAPCP